MSRKRSKRRRRKGSLGPLLRLLSLLLMAVVIVTALTLFFKVNQVEVSGNSRYNKEEILAVIGVEQGDNLILLDKYQIAQQLYTELPYITQVQIKRRLPDALEVEVTEARAVISVEGAGSWWYVSDGGKLLEAVNSTAAQKYLCIKNVEAQEPVISGRLLLPEEGGIDTERLLELVKALEEREILNHLKSIDVANPDYMVLDYSGRFQVELFYDANFDYKLDCLLEAIDKLEPNETGIIRMTMDDENEVRFIPKK